MNTIVSWNLNERQPGDPQKWTYMRDTLKADLVLVQEAVVPSGVRGAYRPSGIAGRDGGQRRWGSAVVALNDHVKITPIGLAEGVWRGRPLGVAPLDAVSRGHVAVAYAEFRDLSLTVISAYGLLSSGMPAERCYGRSRTWSHSSTIPDSVRTC